MIGDGEMLSVQGRQRRVLLQAAAVGVLLRVVGGGRRGAFAADDANDNNSATTARPPADTTRAQPYLKQGRPEALPEDKQQVGFRSDRPVTHVEYTAADQSVVPLDYQVLTEGTASPAACLQASDAAVVDYVLRIESGNLVEDSRYDTGRPVVFRVRRGQLPPALDGGTLGMCVGEQRRIRVRARDNFGSQGLRLGGVSPIPIEAVLYYDVRLLQINPFGR